MFTAKIGVPFTLAASQGSGEEQTAEISLRKDRFCEAPGGRAGLLSRRRDGGARLRHSATARQP